MFFAAYLAKERRKGKYHYVANSHTAKKWIHLISALHLSAPLSLS